ncbi:MAG: MarR family winged helix-turn-helix transcriptional regulator [Caldilineaceae bacterium]
MTKNLPPTADECAQALLEIVPEVMQEIRRQVRGQRGPDLSVLQLRALSFLAGAPGAMLSDLADFVGLTLPSMSSQVSNLVERDLIHRAPSPIDRRCLTLHLTAKGSAMLAAARQGARENLALRLDALDAAERSQVLTALCLLQRTFTASEE